MQRYFVSNKDHNQFKIADEDYHHIINVMRMHLGDQIEVLYNKTLYLSQIIKIDNNFIIAKLIEEIKDNNELDVELIIAQALVKEDKMTLILQKGTELGVTGFIPLIMERSIVKLDKANEQKKIIRWQKICKEASEQSKRNVIPKIYPPMTLKELINLEYDYKLLCSVNEKLTNIKTSLHNVKKSDKIIVVVGPEGGITKIEEQFLVDNDFKPVTLGKRVLRTETVSIFIASCIGYELMR